MGISLDMSALKALKALNVCVITYDRPGYGGSDADSGRSVASAAYDVEAIADDFGYQEFSVIGRSGGGPHALACASLLRDRVTAVACLVGLAPFDARGLNWLHGMVRSNQEHYELAIRKPDALAEYLAKRLAMIQQDPSQVLGHKEVNPRHQGAVSADRKLLIGANGSSIAESFKEGLALTDGWVSDSVAFTKPWGFDPGDIAVPTLLWHGVRDVFSPVTHTQWLADRIQTAELRLSKNGTHLAAIEMQPNAIEWLLSHRPSGGRTSTRMRTARPW